VKVPHQVDISDVVGCIEQDRAATFFLPKLFMTL
jgi:hypothetical protein